MVGWGDYVCILESIKFYNFDGWGGLFSPWFEFGEFNVGTFFLYETYEKLWY